MHAPLDREKRQAAIVDAACYGIPVAQIAATFGLSRNAIYLLLRRRNVTRPPRLSKNRARDDEIIAAMKRGEAATALAARYGLSRGYIYQVLKRRNLQIGDYRSPCKTERNEAVAAAARAGMRVADLAEQFGLSGARIYHIARAHNGRKTVLRRGDKAPAGAAPPSDGPGRDGLAANAAEAGMPTSISAS